MDNDASETPECTEEEYPCDDDDDPRTQRQTMSAIGWLLLYSTAMFTLPFAAYYSTHYALSHYLHIDGFPNICGSVVAAVLVVNIIILLYALRGYEEAKDEDDKKDPDGQGVVSDEGKKHGKGRSKKKESKKAK